MMWVMEIWRYPVKWMAGESLEQAELTESVVSSDRIVQVPNSSGRIMTARTRPLLVLRGGRFHAMCRSRREEAHDWFEAIRTIASISFPCW